MNVAVSVLDGGIVAMSEDFEKGEDYLCLCCAKPVVPHCGAINRWHFKHKALLTCRLSEKSKKSNSMSEFHKRIQLRFFDLGAAIEKHFAENIADVYFNQRVFEIQHSPISIKVVEQRSTNYKKSTGKYPIWILDGKKQNIKNYPKYLLKISIRKTHLTIYHQKIKRKIQSASPIEKMLELCCNLNLIYEYLSEELEGSIPHLLKLYEAAYAIKIQNGLTVKWLNENKSFKNVLKADRAIKANCFSIRQRHLFLTKRKKLLDSLEKYIFKTAFDRRNKLQKDLIDYALQFLNEFECVSIVVLKATNPKYKRKTIHDIDNFYMQKIIGFYFSNKQKYQKNKAYYRNVIYSKLKLELKILSQEK